MLFKYPFLKDPNLLCGMYQTACKRLASLERRLKKAGKVLVDSYSGQVAEWEERGVLRQLTAEEQAGLAIYYPHNFTLKNDSTTPTRICVDASAKSPGGLSLNDILPPGPSCLTSLFAVACGFREKQVGVQSDLAKMYHSVKVYV